VNPPGNRTIKPAACADMVCALSIVDAARMDRVDHGIDIADMLRAPLFIGKMSTTPLSEYSASSRCDDRRVWRGPGNDFLA